MKETAIEWLEKIRQGQKGQPFDDYEWEIAFNHAKEMEKEQIMDAYEIGDANGWNDAKYNDKPKHRRTEQYYNETFNK